MSLASGSSDQTSKQTPVSTTPTSRPSSRTDGRKQLPSIPSPDVQEMMSRSVNKPTMPSNGANGYVPFFQEYALLAEFNQLRTLKTPGIYVIPSAKSPRIWNGVLFIRQGMYQEGVFRFKLTIPDNFPDSDCPSLDFEFPVFHPLVDPVTGQLDVKRAFPKWRRNVNHIWQVLIYARRIFYKMDTNSPLNSEAADMYHQDPEGFKKRVRESVSAAKERLHQPPDTDDLHSIQFSEWDPAVHEEVRQQMLDTKKNQNDERSVSPPSQGMSWILPDTTLIFSRDDPATA